MKNNQHIIKQIVNNKENSKVNIQKNNIEETKIKKKRDIRKILLPMRKENNVSYKKNKSNIEINYDSKANSNLINKKLIFLNIRKKPRYFNNFNSHNNTERSYTNNLQKKKKLLKLSTNDEIFAFYNRKIDKTFLKPNKKTNLNNQIESLTKTFSLKKDNSLNNNEKSLELIEKFADNFRNKERSESLKNVLNMYKRYKSLSSLSNKNKVNNSCSSITIVKNKSYYKKGENNFFNIIHKKQNFEGNSDYENKFPSPKNNLNSYNYNNKENINIININEDKNNKYKGKNFKKYFLRKVVREEKCYIDQDGKIHVVDFKQSLIDDKNKSNAKKKVKNNKRKRSYKNSKNKKINVEINQINNINSYNNISDIHSISDFKKNENNKKFFERKAINNFTERNEPDNLKIIGLTKKLTKKNSNYKLYENKMKHLPQKFEPNIINNDNYFDRITHRNVHSFGKNYSIYYSYKNDDLRNDYNCETKKFIQNQNNIGYNNINNYNYKSNYDPYSDRRIFAQNNDNCSFYESKSLSNYKEKFLKQNNSQIKFFRNNIFDINYTNNPNNDYLYDEDLNNKTFFKSYILDYSYNNYNSKQNTGKISSYRLIRIPKNKN